MRFSSAGSCATWKILHSPAMTSTGTTSTFGHLHLLNLQRNLTKTLSTPRLRVTMQCTYPLAGLYRLFSVYKFESDTVGVGRIEHSTLSTEGRWFNCTNRSMSHADYVWFCTTGPQSPTVEPSIALQKPVPVTSRNKRPGYRPPAQYIKVSSFLKKLQKKGLRFNFKLV